MSGRGATRAETYTVPEGRRAVVRHFAVFNWGAAGASAFLWVHGIPVFYVVFQASNEAKFAEVRFTAYERETIMLSTAGSDISYGVDGFVFTDHDGTPDDADNTISLLELDLPRPLPA